MRRELVRPTELIAGVTRCSPYDSLLRNLVVSLAFCYRELLDPARLRSSLARVLSDFSSFAGKLSERDGALWIEHGVGHVPLEVTQSPELSEALGKAAANSVKQSKQLFPTIAIPSKSKLRARGQEPLLAVRLTRTPEGSVLAVSWIHAAGDMHAGMLLLRAWSRAYRDMNYDKPVQLHDPVEYLTERVPRFNEGTAMHVASWTEWLRLNRQFLKPAIPQRVNLDFSWDELTAIHTSATGDKPVTTHDALCAQVFATIRRLNGGDTKSLLRLSVNYRKRFSLPANLVGNFVDGITMQVGPSDDVARIAADLRAEIEMFPRRPLLHHEFARLDASSSAFAKHLRFVENGIDPSELSMSMLMVSWVGFGMYNLAFGTSTPVYVHCRPTEWFNWYAVVFDSPNQAGLSVRAWLPSKLAKGLARAKAARFAQHS